MSKSIDVDNLVVAIIGALEEYTDTIYQATEKGLDAGEKYLIDELKSTSPKSEGGGDYAKSWKSKGKKYKLKRYVGNVKLVKGKKGEIPLSNILEYSTKSPHQGLIKRTYEASSDGITRAIINEIKKEA